MQLGGLELVVVLAVVGLVLGPSRLPGLARSLGEALHELRDAQRGGPRPPDGG